MDEVFDVAIIGGGINGCGIAADAATRGLSVALIEKEDIASKTSSSSTKLIHGGLRYLESYHFSLVKKSLDERQTLLQLGPHLVSSLPIVLPYEQHMRSSWFLRAGLFIYDYLSRLNTLPKSRLIKRTSQSAYFSPLTGKVNKGFIFYDCRADDARLTVANALQAKAYGATILTREELIFATVKDRLWHLTLKDKEAREKIIKARSIINASGPWVENINERLAIPNYHKISLIKGSHLVVHQLYEGDHAYLLQNEDKRIVFVIPYHGFTMIGTTDVIFSENLDKVAISSNEIDYLFQLVSHYFKHTLSPSHIITTWSGVRPLLASTNQSPQSLSRDYTYHFTEHPAPAVTIYGGKITTYRKLAKEAVDELEKIFPAIKNSRTKNLTLPGGALGEMDYQAYCQYAYENFYWVDKNLLHRLLTTYGTHTEILLSGCSTISDLGDYFGHGLYQQEVDYLVEEEWALDVEDILWRRTKLGLYFTPEDKEKLMNYLSFIHTGASTEQPSHDH